MALKKKERHKKFKEGGKNGGDKTLKVHGTKHFKKIGKEGAQKRWSKPLIDENIDTDEMVV